MPSYFNLKLDTTAPTVAIICPPYTTKTAITDIIVQSDELLDNYQEFYIIDSTGTRVDLTFEYDGNRFVGKVRLNNLKEGFATIYARVRDIVHNKSELVMKIIAINIAVELDIIYNIFTHNINSLIECMDVFTENPYSLIRINSIINSYQIESAIIEGK